MTLRCINSENEKGNEYSQVEKRKKREKARKDDRK